MRKGVKPGVGLGAAKAIAKSAVEDTRKYPDPATGTRATRTHLCVSFSGGFRPKIKG
jgi:hypothetical protein